MAVMTVTLQLCTSRRACVVRFDAFLGGNFECVLQTALVYTSRDQTPFGYNPCVCLIYVHFGAMNMRPLGSERYFT